MKKQFLILLLAFTTIACKNNQNTGEDMATAITNPEDYNKYLVNLTAVETPSFLQTRDSLENVLVTKPSNIVDASRVASMYDETYNKTGNIDALLSYVRFRESVAANTAIKPENAYRLLAQAYIKMHQFQKADSVMKSFTKDYASPASMMVQFDVSMETGDYVLAKTLLDTLRNTKDYNYLIRAAKYNDYAGELNNTISLLEQATTLAEQSGNKEQLLWIYSNLGDYYGHHGDIEKSYNSYLKALELDPTNHYCLKGIAYIAYSHDEKPDEAIRILKKLQETHKIPDYDLMLAEIYESKGDTAKSQEHASLFMVETKDSRYGGMYNLYKIEQWLDGDASEKQQALALAKTEIANRATPETYGFLAEALLANGDKEEALRVIDKYVENKTFEPVAALQMAVVYKAHGKTEALEKIKEDLLGTRYEMGPVTYEKIKSL